MMPSAHRQAGPPRKVAWALLAGVLVLHGVLMLSAPSSLTVQLRPSASSELKARLLELPAAPVASAKARSSTPPQRSQRPPVPTPVAPPTAAPRSTETPSPEPVERAEAAAPATPVDASSPVAVEASQSPLPEWAGASAPASATEALPAAQWPAIGSASLPASALLTYRLTGMDKGLTYHASGELRWQHNDAAYELTLLVRAFLVGSRQWRSTGQLGPEGLAPQRFSDSRRQERAAHFDREQGRVVFSSRSQPAPLEAGAQDQISLYVQLAAAMASAPDRFEPGTRLMVQTVTPRDAQPWSLVLEGVETLELDRQAVRAHRWVCQPRNRFEARVEFWVAPEQQWLPLRIRITQVSGSYIDLFWRDTEALPPLPASVGDTGVGKTS